MKEDITRRPTTQSVKTSLSRPLSLPLRPAAKRPSNVPHASGDVGVKRRIISTTNGITVATSPPYANVTHVQAPHSNSSFICRRKNGPLSAVPPAVTTVTVHSTSPSVVLPPEPSSHVTSGNCGMFLNA